MPRTLAEHLRRVPDPRLDRTKKHALGDVLTVATCAILCGYNSYYDMEDFCTDYFSWLRQWLELAGGVPSHDTFRRVLGLVDPKHFGNVFRLWTEAVWRRVEEDHVAVDGKALRGSADGLGSVQYIVYAWSARRHLVLGQVKVQDKSNEITAIPRLLTAQEALEATRAHWGVESLHWVLDMVLEEDRSRARDKNAAQNLALIRRMVYNVLRTERDAQATEKKVPRLKQLMRRAACKDEVRTRMMRVFGELRTADARPPQEQ